MFEDVRYLCFAPGSALPTRRDAPAKPSLLRGAAPVDDQLGAGDE